METTRSNNDSLYYASLFAAQVMVGINIVGSKFLLAHFSAVFLLCIRFVIATLFLSAIHFLETKINRNKTRPTLTSLTKKDWGFIIAQALCAGVLFNFLLLLGLHHTNASVAGIITSALPAIIALFSIIFLRERLTIFSMLCIFFAVLGLIVINARSFHAADSSNLLGDFIILLSLLPEAGYYVLSKIHTNRLPIFLVAALMNGINLPVLLFVAPFTPHFFSTAFTLESILILGTVGMASALFYVFWYLGCHRIAGSTAGLFTAAMPIATLFIAWLFLGEAITLLQLFGMLLVIASISFNAMRQRHTSLSFS